MVTPLLALFSSLVSPSGGFLFPKGNISHTEGRYCFPERNISFPKGSTFQRTVIASERKYSVPKRKYLVSCGTLLLSWTIRFPKARELVDLWQALLIIKHFTWGWSTWRNTQTCDGQTNTSTLWMSYCWEIFANHRSTWNILYEETL